MTQPQAAVAGPAPKQSRKARRLASKRARKSHQAMPATPAATATPQLHVKLEQAKQLLAAKDHERCEKLLESVIKEHPDDGNSWLILAMSHEFRGSKNLSYHFYKRAVELAPDNADAWLYFGRLLCESQHPQASAMAIERCLALRPNCVESLKILSAVRLDLGDSSGGLAACEAALALEPQWTAGFYIKGLHHKSAGDMEAARESFMRGLALNPRSIDLLHGLTDISKGAQLEDLLERLNAIDPGEISDPKERSDFFFVGARARRALDKHEEAFEMYRQANGLVKELYPFDRDTHRAKIDELISAFTPEVLTQGHATGNDTNRPVFIVGMPRSGSTLTERIITSHSAAHGVGESNTLIEIVDALSQAKDCDMSYPRDVGKMDSRALALVAEQYLSVNGRGCPPDAERFTDKMLFNYLNLGLISLLFPNARIIHCKRNPMDTCTSCYFVRFGNAKFLTFASDLEALGFYYREYDRLMAHWRKVLPVPVLEVEYEKLIADQEAESRRIIDFLGLEWEDACLDFHQQASEVRTASSVQVRQPIYKTSAGRWKLYEKQLAPLLEALGDLA